MPHDFKAALDAMPVNGHLTVYDFHGHSDTPNHQELSKAKKEAIIAALELAIKAQWQHIETAPKDGTFILCYEKWKWGIGNNLTDEDIFVICQWTIDGWFDGDGWHNNVTHWQPLPSPPKETP